MFCLQKNSKIIIIISINRSIDCFFRQTDIEAECQDDYMKIRVGFNGSFTGLLYSSGYSYDPDCIYINGTGRDYYEFYIQLNRCGTLGKNAKAEESRKSSSIAVSFFDD